MIANAEAGYWNGARQPFGYEIRAATVLRKKEKRRLFAGEDEATVVRLIYKLYLEGDVAFQVELVDEPHDRSLVLTGKEAPLLFLTQHRRGPYLVAEWLAGAVPVASFRIGDHHVAYGLGIDLGCMAVAGKRAACPCGPEVPCSTNIVTRSASLSSAQARTFRSCSRESSWAASQYGPWHTQGREAVEPMRWCWVSFRRPWNARKLGRPAGVRPWAAHPRSGGDTARKSPHQ